MQPDLVHLHLVNTPAYTQLLSERYPTVASVHNHFLTCPPDFGCCTPTIDNAGYSLARCA